MMNSTYKGWQYLILGLAGLGFLIQLIRAPFSILLPVLIIAVIYFLYKSPPRWLLKFTSPARHGVYKKGKSKKSSKKKRPFRVIDGKKKEPF